MWGEFRHARGSELSPKESLNTTSKVPSIDTQSHCASLDSDGKVAMFVDELSYSAQSFNLAVEG